jgi:hypothetical protein
MSGRKRSFACGPGRVGASVVGCDDRLLAGLVGLARRGFGALAAAVGVAGAGFGLAGRGLAAVPLAFGAFVAGFDSGVGAFGFAGRGFAVLAAGFGDFVGGFVAAVRALAAGFGGFGVAFERVAAGFDAADPGSRDGPAARGITSGSTVRRVNLWRPKAGGGPEAARKRLRRPVSPRCSGRRIVIARPRPGAVVPPPMR